MTCERRADVGVQLNEILHGLMDQPGGVTESQLRALYELGAAAGASVDPDAGGGCAVVTLAFAADVDEPKIYRRWAERENNLCGGHGVMHYSLD